MIATVPAVVTSTLGPEGTIEPESSPGSTASPITPSDVEPVFDWRLDADELSQERDLRPPNAIGAALLHAVVEEIAWFGLLPHGKAMNLSNWLMRRFRERGVPYRPRDWFGRTTERDRQRFSRACLRLERDGYLIRITEPLRDRVMYVQPTLDGLRWIFQSSADFDSTPVIEGLRRTDWGRWMAEKLESEVTDQ
jgi:hypothetical protein